MKRKNITILNISDYIRQEKRRLVDNGGIKMLDGQRFYWNYNEWEIVKYFIKSATCDIFTGDKGVDLKEGDRFMGAKHFKFSI